MLIYPPGNLYQRGEDRCQLNVSESSANSMRACNDLGYASAVLKQRGYKIFLKDYQSERLDINALLEDVKKEQPDVIFLSTTNATIFSDIEIIKKIKNQKEDIIVILKGAIFYDCNEHLLSKINANLINYLIGGEEEFIIGDLIDYHFNDVDRISTLPSIIYNKNGKFIKTNNNVFCEDLDSLPFPDRAEMNNELYVMPDTGEKLATISTSRGCPSSCIYCLSPHISGKKIRFRSSSNILEELKECFFKFGIKNFFFKADTFTINSDWTNELCEKIINSKLNGKINWVANSRVNTINPQMLSLMKKAGCSLIAFGLESGSNESLQKMKKNTTIEQNYQAVQMAKQAGLSTFGFYIIGFPWEDFSHFELTRKAMLKNNTDFIEVHIATPFVGTEFYNILQQEGRITDEVYGKSHFNCINSINTNLNPEDVENYRKKIVLEYYLRPSYLYKKISNSILKPKILYNYFKFGTRLIKNSIKSNFRR